MREYFSHKKKISSVSEFASLAAELCKNEEEICSCSGAYISSKNKRVCFYRGVSKARTLKSVNYNDGKDLCESEYEMYKDVRCIFPKEFLRDTKTIDKLIRVQHYGIPARLVNVTYDPLVALFFAAGGFKAIEEKDGDGRVIFFCCESESIIFSDDSKPCVLSDSENAIGYGDFVCALDVFRKFLTACKAVENLSNVHLKNTLNELIGDIRKALNSVTTDFMNIYTAICCMELLVDSLWDVFRSEGSANGLEEEGEFRDLLMKAYSEYVSEYIRKTAGELKLDVDVPKIKNLASFMGSFCNFFFVEPKASNELIKRQQGAFLLHPSVAHAFNLDDFNLQKTSGLMVKSIMVDSGSKSNILKELREHGLTFNYLFPGVVNYRKDIYSEYSLKK